MEGIGRRKMKGGDEVDYNLVKNFKIRNKKKQTEGNFILTYHSADKVHRHWRPQIQQAKSVC